MTPEQQALIDAINIAGGQSELARMISANSGIIVKQQQIWNWLNREKRPPAKQAVLIEKVTGVNRERLRPDLFR